MQGFNMGRYVPPDQEGLVSGNKLHGKHALGSRANKISQGILTVRFEMPYPIWCTTCPKPTIIGQGVRFNAEKKKVGNYYSTPIYSFRMKHTACGGWIEIRTDPKNTAYVVIEGARQRDLGENQVREGDMEILTEEEREKMRGNAFTALEGKVEDKQRLEQSKQRLEELYELSEQWEDPYERNRKLRATFRMDRKEREREAAVASALQDKMSLAVDLLPEHEDDKTLAQLIEYGKADLETTAAKAISKPLFSTGRHAEKPSSGKSKVSRSSKKLKSEQLAMKKAAAIVAEIQGNTRAAIDPFLQENKTLITGTSRVPLAGIKRKRIELDRADAQEQIAGQPFNNGLVDYESD